MDNEEKNRLIAKLLGEGNSLSEVQKILQSDYDVKMTYMDLRLISSELEVDWQKFDTNNPKNSSDKDLDKENPVDSVTDILGTDGNGQGKTSVTVNKVVRPGTVMSGDVKFKSGGTAEWQLDPLGRLGLNPTGDSSKPSEEDLREFQLELQRTIQGNG